MPKGIPLTKEEQEKRRHEIFHQVVPIVSKKGFHETSMREIADAAGLGKSTLYDYFKTKDEILIYFFEDQLNDMTEEAQRIALQNLSADKRLRQVMEAYIQNLQTNKSLFLKLTQESQRLKVESQKQIQKKRHAYQDLIRALIDEGIREGVFREVNSLQAARYLPQTLCAEDWKQRRGMGHIHHLRLDAQLHFLFRSLRAGFLSRERPRAGIGMRLPDDEIRQPLGRGCHPRRIGFLPVRRGAGECIVYNRREQKVLS